MSRQKCARRQEGAQRQECARGRQKGARRQEGARGRQNCARRLESWRVELSWRMGEQESWRGGKWGVSRGNRIAARSTGLRVARYSTVWIRCLCACHWEPAAGAGGGAEKGRQRTERTQQQGEGARRQGDPNWRQAVAPVRRGWLETRRSDPRCGGRGQQLAALSMFRVSALCNDFGFSDLPCLCL